MQQATEIYLLDAATLRFLDVNEAAQSNLGYSLVQLETMTPFDLAPAVAPAQLRTLLDDLGDGVDEQGCLRTLHRRADGSTYPVTLHFRRSLQGGRPCILAFGDDRSADQAAANALEQVQARFNAIVSNMPGLAFQCVAHADHSYAFPYLSDACHALLGMTPPELQANPTHFLDLVLPEDRASWLASMRASAASLTPWNWEGRIWIGAWNDQKWINLRATPRALEMPPGSVIWDGIMTNISASRRDHARLAELTAHIEQVKEQERSRIAREVHDELGGNLTAIKMALAMLARRAPQELHERTEYVDALVDRTIEAIHRISLDLRPSILDFGIVPALEWLVREFEKQNGILCSIASDSAEIELPPDSATALFRIVQEALTNIAKHAGASLVKVELERTVEGLAMRITDDGRGIAPPDRQKPQSFGLRGMAERAQALGGSFSAGAAPGRGTQVAINIPLPRPIV